MGRVEGLVAIVTGAASGLGYCDSQVLAREGAQVVLTDINETAGRAAARSIGRGAIFKRHDVRSEDDWKRLMAETMGEFGRLDILVNNAGVVVLSELEETTLEQFRHVNQIMSEGVFLGCKQAIAAMTSSGGGSIINMASTASHLGFSKLIGYSAAKGAVRSMTKSVAMYCQEKGNRIRCNSIHPGTIETPMVQMAHNRVGKPIEVPGGVLGADAIGDPSDVANLVLYLGSSESRFITGAEFLVDNGLTVRPRR